MYDCLLHYEEPSPRSGADLNPLPHYRGLDGAGGERPPVDRGLSTGPSPTPRGKNPFPYWRRACAHGQKGNRQKYLQIGSLHRAYVRHSTLSYKVCRIGHRRHTSTADSATFDAGPRASRERKVLVRPSVHRAHGVPRRARRWSPWSSRAACGLARGDETLRDAVEVVGELIEGQRGGVGVMSVTALMKSSVKRSTVSKLLA